MAERYTLTERAQLAARYEVWQSVIAVQRWWRSVHGSHAQVDARTIKNCHSKLMTTGSVADTHRSGRCSTSNSPESVQMVEEMFTRSPGKSTRQGARESGLSRYTVRTVLKRELQWRAWKPHYCQSLSAEDCDIRLEFGESMLSWHAEWPELFRNVIWSDEAVFHVGGFVNRHNCHYWAGEDPRATTEKLQTRPSVTVWCGMTADRIVGPVLLRNTMNAERYLSMLRDDVWPIVSTWDNIHEVIFMQDGAPPHFALTVREWLSEHFPGRWLGRRGPLEWPARSPDLTPCDFFLWGWAKEEVYRTKPQTLDDLEARIRQVLTSVEPAFLSKSVDAIPRRLQTLVERGGSHVEF